MWALVLPILLFLTIINYRSFRDLRYPPFIMSALWFVVMTLYYSAPTPIHSISVVTAFIFVAAVISFTFGGQLAFLCKSNPYVRKAPDKGLALLRAHHPRVKKMLLLASIALLPALLYKARQLADLSGVDNFFMGLRIELLSEGSPGYGLIGNATILSFFTTFIYSIELDNKKWEKAEYFCSLMLSLVYAVLTTGRLAIFLVLVALTGIALIKRRFSVKKLILGILIFVLAFAAISMVLGKGGELNAPWSDNIITIGQTLRPYVIGSVPAFDLMVRENAPLTWGENTFSGFLNFVYRMEGHRLISEIPGDVSVPFTTNVYTALRPSYKDFGILGVTLSLVLIGAASTYFYFKAVAGDQLYVLYYAISLVPLLLMTVGDQYFGPALSWAKYFLAGYLYFRTGGNGVRSVAFRGRQDFLVTVPPRRP